MENLPVVGIVAEYNPFHNGHAYQLVNIKEKIGEAYIIACLSGSFVQRGEPALASKWDRAAVAVQCGVDLVLELPAAYACRSSEFFASGAVQTLHATGLLTHLAFGCETKDPASLAQLACLSLPKVQLQAALKAGLSYAAAQEKFLAEQFPGSRTLLRQPNNILALAYYQALAKLSKTPQALPITRKGAGYNSQEITSAMASASALRQELRNNGYTIKVKQAVPSASGRLLKTLSAQKQQNSYTEKLGFLLQYKISQLTPEKIALYADTSEGLENKIYQAAQAPDFYAMLKSLQSKRYPNARLQRLLYQLLISTSEVPFTSTKLAPAYLRVLAFNTRGRTLLKAMKTAATLPQLNKLGKNIFSQYPDPAFKALLKTDFSATNLFDILQGLPPCWRDYTQSPIYIKE